MFLLHILLAASWLKIWASIVEGVEISLAYDVQGRMIFSFSFSCSWAWGGAVCVVGGEFLKMREDQEEAEGCRWEVDGRIRINLSSKLKCPWQPYLLIFRWRHAGKPVGRTRFQPCGKMSRTCLASVDVASIFIYFSKCFCQQKELVFR